MNIVETNIEELSKMLSKEYECYENRIIKLESTLNRIKIMTQCIQKQQGLSPYIQFECNQILNEIKEAVSEK